MTKQAKERSGRLALRQEVILRCLFLLASLLLSPASVAMSFGLGAPHFGRSAQSVAAQRNSSGGWRDAQSLKRGEPVERELGLSESHTYRISLSAEQFLHIVVEQRGINVVAALFGPDGQRLAEVDSLSGTQGPEHFLYVAGNSGIHLLEIRSTDRHALSGRYGVRVEEQRPATTQDRSRVAAYKFFFKGQQLLAQATAVSLREAIIEFDKTLPLWRSLGDRRAEAVTLSQRGKAYDSLGEKAKALDSYRQALSLLEAVGDRAGEATALNNIGLIYDSLGEKQKALGYYNQALPILHTAGDRRGEAYTLSNIGLAYDALGEKQRALDYYKEALGMLQAVGDQRAEAITINNIGFAYHSLGEKGKALDYFGRALRLLRAVGDRHIEAVTINNIGYVHDSLGDQRKALEHFEQALPILRLVGDRRVEAITLNNLGVIYESLGEKQKALDYFGRSLPLRRAVGDRQGEAITLADIGQVHASSGEQQKALSYYDQALSLSRAVGDRSLEATILRRIALVERDRGNLIEARTRIEAALTIIESLRIRIISQELRASYFALVQQYFETYIDLLMRLHGRHPGEGHDGTALRASERARARGLLEMLHEAGARIREGVAPELLGRERSLQQMLNAKAAVHARLMQSDHDPEQAAALKEEIKHLLAQSQDVEAQIRAGNPRYSALTQPSPLGLEEIQQRVLDPETLLLEYALGAEKSYLWAVTSESLQSFELPPRGEIESATRHVYELLAARNRHVKFETAAQRRERIATADAEYPRAAASLSQVLLSPIAAMLGKSGKRRILVVGDGALNYVPFAALPLPEMRRLPEALGRGDGKRVSTSPSASPPLRPSYIPLVVEHEVVSLPSASTLEVLRRETATRKLAPKTLAVLADPVFEKDDERVKANSTGAGPTKRGGSPIGVHGAVKVSSTEDLDRGQQPFVAEGGGQIRRLPFTRREATEILSLVAEADRLAALDFDASRATATSVELGQYRYLHFATHGFLNSEHPELSGIVLSLVDRKGGEQDGFLWSHEVFNLKLTAELVALSGCRTGLGKEIKGEGIIGLTRGFMYAGAARVLVSLWDVSDEASAQLMARFYRGMLGEERLRPAAALRAAQISIWKERRWSAPFYWAAFVLQGEPK